MYNHRTTCRRRGHIIKVKVSAAITHVKNDPALLSPKAKALHSPHTSTYTHTYTAPPSIFPHTLSLSLRLKLQAKYNLPTEITAPAYSFRIPLCMFVCIPALFFFLSLVLCRAITSRPRGKNRERQWFRSLCTRKRGTAVVATLNPNAAARVAGLPLFPSLSLLRASIRGALSPSVSLVRSIFPLSRVRIRKLLSAYYTRLIFFFWSWGVLRGF